jgi:dipeptidyl aminopeptidase/acylaminoacyl peptidase
VTWLVVVGYAGVASAQRAGPVVTRHLAIGDLYRLRDVEDVALSPDGGWVAYDVKAIDSARDEQLSAVYVTSWDGATTRRLTWSTEGEHLPRWRPDGRALAFLSGRTGEHEGADKLWVMPHDATGGEAERVTDLPGGVTDYVWSPDGQRVAIIALDPDPDSAATDAGPGPECSWRRGSTDSSRRPDSASGKKKTPKPIVITRFQFLEDATGWLTERRRRLYVVDVATHAATLLTPGAVDAALPAWSPDGQRIAYVRKSGDDGDRTDNFDVYVIDAHAGAEPRQVTTFEGRDNDPEWEGGPPAWSPDGRSIAYTEGGPPEFMDYSSQNLMVSPATGGPSRSVAPTLDRLVTHPHWAPDGRGIYFLVEDDRAVHLVRAAAAGGPVEQIVAGRQVIANFDINRSGRIALVSETVHAPSDVFVLEAGAHTPRQLTHANPWLDSVALAPVHEISARSADGTVVNGFMVTPPDYAPGHRYPTILRNHGGPVWEWGNEFYFDWQLLAAHGYVVVAGNPRGSSGRGAAYSRAIYADWGNKDVADVLALVDTTVALGIADSARLGVGGWSYGAILTNAVIARTPRFKAATSGAGQSNAFAGYGTDEYVRDYEHELGRPWAHPDAWQRVSYAFFHADRIVTPTLFLCGDLDANVPLLNSEQMYQALRSLGVDTQLIVYPGEYHEISAPSHERDRLERYLAWYDRYLMHTGGERAAR